MEYMQDTEPGLHGVGGSEDHQKDLILLSWFFAGGARAT